MSSINEQAIRVLAESMIKIIQDTDFGFDRTRIGLVKKVNGDNTFTVNFDGAEYNNVKCTIALDGKIKLNDVVRITIPCGKYSNMYISSL